MIICMSLPQKYINFEISCFLANEIFKYSKKLDIDIEHFMFKRKIEIALTSKYLKVKSDISAMFLIYICKTELSKFNDIIVYKIINRK